ncbi:SDR family NAD(P)-dependent oxidoreductase [Bradyrhizobium sp. CSA207]|uniref:SDR family NAD(P)-dependent oxidoreductase n=1 Tax=Bradyrhizobium sp. CSA207 TaxID=2698826 RepID=UPI0023AF6B38|nr:SDR family NAD(P)-dependent oxidoreductase [Bradyrhizobium sp. CSA207]
MPRAPLLHYSHGRVINLGSLAGKRVGGNVGYAMTKFAVVALTHGIRREGRAAGIRATVICPGYVATDMTLNDDEIPRHEMSQPGDIARLAETALMLARAIDDPALSDEVLEETRAWINAGLDQQSTS